MKNQVAKTAPKKASKKRTIKIPKKLMIAMAGVLVLLLVFLAFSLYSKPGRMKDTAFDNGSEIHFTQVSDVQTENLSHLCKVWGFVKYRHPDVVGAKINWDAELFRVMPKVLAAKSADEANSAMFAWLGQFPFDENAVSKEALAANPYSDKKVVLAAELDWIGDKAALGADLSGYLTSLAKVPVLSAPLGYAVFPKEDFRINMDTEANYAHMEYDDTGMRLLGLFRYWNIVEYFFPYRDIMDEDWNDILTAAIPEFVSGQDNLSYVRSLATLSTKLQDSHVVMIDPQTMIEGTLGRNVPPVEFMQAEGSIVISAVDATRPTDENSLKIGDVILTVDGETIDRRMERCKEYIALSNEERFAAQFQYYLMSTNQDSVVIELLRDGKPLTLTVKCFNNKKPLSGQKESCFYENETVGYLNPGLLKKGDLDDLMKRYANTKGLIIDLRNYPGVPIAYDLAEYLIPKSTPFARFACPSLLSPGDFVDGGEATAGNGTVAEPEKSPSTRAKWCS